MSASLAIVTGPPNGLVATVHDRMPIVLDPGDWDTWLDEGAKLSMEMSVQTGKGYVPGTSTHGPDAPIGLVPVDATRPTVSP
mgnify:CR=1 FL=1